jgi:uncharacterized membrane protein YdfJ with MMPL/SSD domain
MNAGIAELNINTAGKKMKTFKKPKKAKRVLKLKALKKEEDTTNEVAAAKKKVETAEKKVETAEEDVAAAKDATAKEEAVKGLAEAKKDLAEAKKDLAEAKLKYAKLIGVGADDISIETLIDQHRIAVEAWGSANAVYKKLVNPSAVAASTSSVVATAGTYAFLLFASWFAYGLFLHHFDSELDFTGISSTLDLGFDAYVFGVGPFIYIRN